MGNWPKWLGNGGQHPVPKPKSWILYFKECEHTQSSTTISKAGRRAMCVRCKLSMRTVERVEPVY